jgi:hypothetical protein
MKTDLNLILHGDLAGDDLSEENISSIFRADYQVF